MKTVKHYEATLKPFKSAISCNAIIACWKTYHEDVEQCFRLSKKSSYSKPDKKAIKQFGQTLPI